MGFSVVEVIGDFSQCCLGVVQMKESPIGWVEVRWRQWVKTSFTRALSLNGRLKDRSRKRVKYLGAGRKGILPISMTQALCSADELHGLFCCSPLPSTPHPTLSHTLLQSVQNVRETRPATRQSMASWYFMCGISRIWSQQPIVEKGFSQVKEP